MTNQESDRPTTAQPNYLAEETSWHDLKRVAAFIYIFGFGFFVVTIYLALYLSYLYSKLSTSAGSSEWWTELFNQGAFGELVIVAVAILILITPAMFELFSLKIISRAAESFTKSFYALPDTMKIGKLIQRRVFGVPPLPGMLSNIINYPFILVKEDKLDDKFSWATFLGGPAKLIIYDGHAVYLERGGKFSRVVGSGIGFLERFETIKEIIDIRPQVKDISFEAWTKDGIPLTVHIRLECQILCAKDAVSSQKKLSQESERRNYPFHADSVRKAVDATYVRLDKDGHLKKCDWAARVCENVDKHIRIHIYSKTIDQLLRGQNEGKTTSHLLSTEQGVLFQDGINKDICDFGARLINLQIVKVDTPPDVDRQWAENWGSVWKSINTIKEGESMANRIRIQEIAHSEAQKDMILSIAESLENMDEQEMREYLILSLSDMLENSRVDPYIQSVLPRETMETLERLQRNL